MTDAAVTTARSVARQNRTRRHGIASLFIWAIMLAESARLVHGRHETIIRLNLHKLENLVFRAYKMPRNMLAKTCYPFVYNCLPPVRRFVTIVSCPHVMPTISIDL
jgi:hypothetical protein